MADMLNKKELLSLCYKLYDEIQKHTEPNTPESSVWLEIELDFSALIDRIDSICSY